MYGRILWGLGKTCMAAIQEASGEREQRERVEGIMRNCKHDSFLEMYQLWPDLRTCPLRHTADDRQPFARRRLPSCSQNHSQKPRIPKRQKTESTPRLHTSSFPLTTPAETVNGTPTSLGSALVVGRQRGKSSSPYT